MSLLLLRGSAAATSSNQDEISPSFSAATAWSRFLQEASNKHDDDGTVDKEHDPSGVFWAVNTLWICGVLIVVIWFWKFNAADTINAWINNSATSRAQSDRNYRNRVARRQREEAEKRKVPPAKRRHLLYDYFRSNKVQMIVSASQIVADIPPVEDLTATEAVGHNDDIEVVEETSDSGQKEPAPAQPKEASVDNDIPTINDTDVSPDVLTFVTEMKDEDIFPQQPIDNDVSTTTDNSSFPDEIFSVDSREEEVDAPPPSEGVEDLLPPKEGELNVNSSSRRWSFAGRTHQADNGMTLSARSGRSMISLPWPFNGGGMSPGRVVDRMLDSGDRSFSTADAGYLVLQDRSPVPNCCAVCLSSYEEGDSVVWSKACPHVFHEDCVTDWLIKMQEDNPCPCCRSVFVDLTEEAAKRTRIVQHSTMNFGVISL